mmetsp:Transcript_116745/g.183583  ORF Transcript_116745/g.183583 Transcript_116745/m.183583 type:complete len:193 (+) Transcript_116745:97-675(+)
MRIATSALITFSLRLLSVDGGTFRGRHQPSLSPSATNFIRCCCRGARCWQSPVHDREDWTQDEDGKTNEDGHKHMDGSKVGYGSGEATKDWGNEHGENSEHNARVGDTCYWKDRKGPRKPGEPEDCSHSFHPPEQEGEKSETTEASTPTTSTTTQNPKARQEDEKSWASHQSKSLQLIVAIVYSACFLIYHC